jgi:iron complex outermembrane recepter protein
MRRHGGAGSRGRRAVEKVALGGQGWAVLVLAGLAGMAAMPAIGAERQGAPAASIAQSGVAKSYRILAQPLTAAIGAFSEQSGIQVAYTTADLAGLDGNAVTGSHTAQEALRLLLAGTGVIWRFTGERTVVLEKPESTGAVLMNPVTVEGAAESAFGPVDGYVAKRSATGTKTDVPILEIPQIVNVVTADQIRDQGAQSLSQALRYTPGVRSEGYGASSPFDAYTQLRGFRSDLYLDGLRLPRGSADGLSSSVVEPWSVERVEVLKGPASGLYGQNGPGGLINMVSKRPTETPYREAQIQGGSFERIQGALDLSGPVDEEGSLLYRVTGLVHDSGTQVDYAEDKRAYVAPALTWRPGKDTTLTLIGNYQRDWGVWSYFNYMPAVGSLHDFNGMKIATDTFLGEPDYNTLDSEQYSIGYAFEHRVNEIVSLRQNLRYGHTDFSTQGVVTGRSDLNADGTIDRLAIQVDSDAAAFAVDNQVQMDFKTGPLGHKLAGGIDFRRESVKYLFEFGAAPSLDVFDPVYGSPVTSPDTSVEDYRSVQYQVGAYAEDQIKYGGWIVTGGARFDWARSDFQNNATAFASASRTIQKDTAVTGRAGLEYLFASGIAPYVSYATSFQPETGLDDVTGEPFKPSTGEQYELGVKYQPPGVDALVTVSAFRLTQQNRITQDDLFQQRQIGEVEVRGIEVEGKAELFEGLGITAAYAYLETEITESANAAEVGLELFSTPKHQASLWADYRVSDGPLAGFGAGAGVRYIGTTLDSANTLKVPSVTVVDARAEYALGSVSSTLAGATLAVNVTNLFDKVYVSQCDGSTMCTYGNRRTILATLDYKW